MYPVINIHDNSCTARDSSASLRDRVLGANVFSLPRYVINAFVLFSALFEFNIVGPITSRKLCVAWCFFYLFIHWRDVRMVLNRSTKRDVALFIGMLLCCVLISMSNDAAYVHVYGSTYAEPHYYLWIILYALVFPCYFSIACKTFREFCAFYICIMLFESFAVFAAAVSSEVRFFFYDNFYVGDARFDSTIYWGTRVIGIYLHSSTGSIIMALSCALLVVLALREEIKPPAFFFGYGIIAAATFLVGRTGFLLEVAVLLLFLLLERGVSKKLLMFVGLLVVGFGVGSFVLSAISPGIARNIVNWAIEFFNPETRTETWDILTSMKVPDFSPELIFGTNVTLGMLPNGDIMGSDSGYAKTYCAIGIIGFFLYYSSFVALFRAWKIKDGMRVKLFMFVLACASFVVEIKEPYFQKYVLVIVFVTISMFLSQESISGQTGKG